MKKWLWAIPIAIILITGVAIGTLNGKDVDPDAMVKKTELSELDIMMPAAAATLADEAEGQSLIELENTDTLKLYLSTGSSFEPTEKAYNRIFYTKDLGNGWTYVLEYHCEITFAEQYQKQIAEHLGDWVSVIFYLKDKADCPSPATQSKSSYVVQADVTLADGRKTTVFLDPKTKQYIGEVNTSTK